MFGSSTLVAKRRLGAENSIDPNDGRLRICSNATNGTLLTDPGCSLVAASGDKDRYLLAFEPDDTKNDRELEGELPPEMTQLADRYLKVHRKNLLARGAGDPTNSLWIDRWGQPMADHSIRAQIKSRTAHAFGRHVWPHLFRAIAAIGFVDLAPEDAIVVPDLLGHASTQTAHKHDVLSEGMLAHRKVQSSVLKGRTEASARLRNANRGERKPGSD